MRMTSSAASKLSFFSRTATKSISKTTPRAASPSTSSTELTDKPVKLHSRSSKWYSRNPGQSSSLSGLMLSEAENHDERLRKPLTEEVSSILLGSSSIDSLDLREATIVKSPEETLNIPWLDMSKNQRPPHKKELSRDRKCKWIYKNSQGRRFDLLVKMCGEKLGTEAIMQALGKLGRENGLKEYNSLIGICIKKARETNDEEAALDEIEKAFRLFESMKEQGFKIGEDTYGPFLTCFIDMGMVEKFHFFSRLIKDANAASFSRLGYYEMLLYVKTNQEEMIQCLCNSALCHDGGDKFDLIGNYILALCEGDREELLQLLPVMDIQKISSLDSLTRIFTCLGKLKLDSFAEQFLLALKSHDHTEGYISHFIFNYAAYTSNLVVEDVIFKYKSLHEKLEVKHSSTSYESLIKYCCASLKVHVALDIAEEMCDAGLTLSMEVVHSILRASEESYDFNLVHRIHSMISHHSLGPTADTFTWMIHLVVKMKDFAAAYNMLVDLGKMNLKPTSRMYNAIMRGYFREKNIKGALMVLKQMKEANVEPDSETFSCLISNCNTEEEINEFYEEVKRKGIEVTKYIYMALINAYAACGQFEKAKQVIKDKGVPVKSLNEIKSVLVSVLASNGQNSDALELYEEIKHDGCNVEPRAILSLIEYFQSDGELSKLLQLLKELNDPDYRIDGCYRVILYCIKFKHLSAVVDLLKQVKDLVSNDEMTMEVIFDEVFSIISEGDMTLLQIGLDLLHVIKNDMGLTPSRKALDFLLSACVNAKDLDKSLLIWKEYQAAGLPYNIMSFLRMYQALLASGDPKAAKIIQKKISMDDADVRFIIQKCRATYADDTISRRE